MAQNNNPNEEFQKKIDRAFPASGIPALPVDDLSALILSYRNLAETMKVAVPHSRERSLAFSRLEECFLWSILGLARK